MGIGYRGDIVSIEMADTMIVSRAITCGAIPKQVNLDDDAGTVSDL